MDKIRSLFAGKSKEKEPTFIKEDIWILVEDIKDTIIREDGYVIIGYYNKDGSKFKDILTGKVYDNEYLDIGKDKSMRLISDGRTFYSMGNLQTHIGRKIRNCVYEVYISENANWLGMVMVGTSEYTLFKDRHITYIEQKYMPLFKFRDKEMFDEVKLSEIKKIAKILNNEAYKYVKEKIEHQEKLDGARLQSRDYKEF